MPMPRPCLARRLSVAVALLGVTACVHAPPLRTLPDPGSSLEAARLAEANHWVVRITSPYSDTLIGQVRVEGGRIHVGDKDLAPGEVRELERRVGSTHMGLRTALTVGACATIGLILGVVRRQTLDPEMHAVAPLHAWALAGASTGLVVAVAAEFGMDESRWEPLWRQ
jgi:hypothetical protein